jgi:peptidyl-prolyl cis-trans isomerase A (cyclophilin A)
MISCGQEILMKIYWLVSVMGLTLLAAAEQQKARKPGIYAVFETSMGTFVCELYDKNAPLAVQNLIGLAEGSKEWLGPKGDMMKNKRYYDGINFHRVVKDFMIQAGDITGKGTFNPVLPFADEITPSLRFDKPGVMAMANSGKNTNNSQFFITVKPQPHLNGKHTIFGRVVEGFEVVESISNVRVSFSRPVKDVVIRKLRIERVVRPPR